MPEYIERGALRNALLAEGCYTFRGLGLLNRFPAADVAPVVHGRWEGTADGYWGGELVYDIWNCSECGFDADGADEKPDWNYCPNCGAKMDAEDEGGRE